jgi:excisionase family DNA binding protein
MDQGIVSPDGAEPDTPAGPVGSLEAVFEAIVRRVVREELARRLGDRPAAAAGDTALMTYQQAAERCGLPVTTLREAARRGDLAVVRLGPRNVRILPADLARWFGRRRVPARDEGPVRLRVAGGRR